MLSLIDTLMQIPMPALLESIPIDLDMKAALVGEESHIGVALEFVRSYEAGDWNDCESLLRRMHFEHGDLSGLYIQSIAWANQIMCSDKPTAPV